MNVSVDGLDTLNRITEENTVIRCKECKYWRLLIGNADGYGVCRADNQVQTSSPDWFCADGVRKNETDRR